MTEPLLGQPFKDALVYAVEIHGNDLRKGTSIPYISHLLGVCALVLEDGGDQEEAIAALLHDALEDHPEEVTRSELDRRFGPRVAELVELCTDTLPDYQGGPKAPWHERKVAYVRRIREEKYPKCRVSLADKLHNARAIMMDYRRLGDRLWSRFNAPKGEQLGHYRALVEAFRQAGAPCHLVDELEALVSELDREKGPA